MEDLEDTKYFYGYDLPDILTPDDGNVFIVMRVMNLFLVEVTS